MYRWIDSPGGETARPDHPVFDHTAFDLMELGDPPQRRFHMSMMDNGERQITVLDSLRDGLFRNIRNSERRRWTGIVGRADLQEGTKRRIVEAAEEAAGQWLEDELKRGDSMLCLNPLSPDEKEEMGALLLRLPYEFFSGYPNNTEEDRAMVAESVVRGKRLLISENRKSVRQPQLNRWLKEEGWIQDDQWIRGSSEVLRHMERAVTPDAIYIWALGALLPDSPSGRDVETIVRNAQALRRAGLAYAGQRVEQELQADPDVSQTFGQIRSGLPRRARDTEMRRVSKVKRAANSEGYGI